MHELLAQGGLTMKDVNNSYVADPSARVEALGSGALDVAALQEPWLTRAQKTGSAVLWMPFSAVTHNLPVGLIVYGPRLLESNKDAGVRFMTAYLRAARQFNEGKTDRNVALISEFTKLPPEDVRSACLVTLKPDGSADTQIMLDFQHWMLENGMVDKALPLDQFWTDEFILEAGKRQNP
jgi:NitT/TauT family transport system substrate-binding protein